MDRNRSTSRGRSSLGFLSLIVLAGIGLWVAKLATDSLRSPTAPQTSRPEAALPIVEARATPAQQQRKREQAAVYQAQAAALQAQADAAEATPDPELVERQKQIDRQNSQARLEIEQARLAQALVSAYPGGPARPGAQDELRFRCQAARNNRQAALDRAGLNRNFDLLRKLDDEVYEACKGL